MSVPESVWRTYLARGLGDRIEVKGGWDFATARGDLKRDTLYVMRVGETGASDPNITNQPRQTVTTRMGLLYGFRNFRDARGAAAANEIEQVRDAVSALLLGWEPDGFALPGVCYYGSGSALSIQAQAAWWQDEWRLPEFRHIQP